MAGSPTAAVVRAVQTLAVDQVTAEAVGALRRRGIRPILLKGPAIARWLYPDGGRSYVDTDLLVDPGLFAAAGAVLGELGFAQDSCERAWQASSTYYRSVPGTGARLSVDLHRSLRHAGAPPGAVWATLGADTVTITVAGAEVEVLGAPALLAHIALHAAQHRGGAQQLEDLRRALAATDADDWLRALAVARRLGAEDCLAAGLRLVPKGRRLADRLGLASDLRLTVRITGATTGAQGLQRLADASSIRDLVHVLHDVLVPSAPMMRRLSPLARRGRLGLRLAYLGRPARLVRRLGPAVRTWRLTRDLP